MTPIRKVRITGGLTRHDAKVVDAETGQELYVQSIELKWTPHDGGSYSAKVELAAEVDVTALVQAFSITHESREEDPGPGLLEAGHQSFVADIDSRRARGEL